jgi:BolA protein
MIESRTEQIRSRLESAFGPARITIRDDSASHAGHAGARDGAGHFAVRIESQAFTGRNRLQRHRMVYETLAELMPDHIHALNIEAISPDDDMTLRTP